MRTPPKKLSMKLRLNDAEERVLRVVARSCKLSVSATLRKLAKEKFDSLPRKQQEKLEREVSRLSEREE